MTRDGASLRHAKAAVFPLFLVAPAWAEAQVINTDRPDQTESSAVVPLRLFSMGVRIFEHVAPHGFGGNIPGAWPCPIRCVQREHPA